MKAVILLILIFLAMAFLASLYQDKSPTARLIPRNTYPTYQHDHYQWHSQKVQRGIDVETCKQAAFLWISGGGSLGHRVLHSSNHKFKADFFQRGGKVRMICEDRKQTVQTFVKR